MGLPSKFPPELVARAQRFQAKNDGWSIKSVDGGSYFVAEEKVHRGAHIICDPSLKNLMDLLESADNA